MMMSDEGGSRNEWEKKKRVSAILSFFRKLKEVSAGLLAGSLIARGCSLKANDITRGWWHDVKIRNLNRWSVISFTRFHSQNTTCIIPVKTVKN